jgi:hypothetical protein
MNPKQNNSNIYMPQTRRCTVSGLESLQLLGVIDARILDRT